MVTNSNQKSATTKAVPSKRNESLHGLLQQDREKGAKPHKSASSVAGDQLIVDKHQSLTGEVYLRSDGKKVRVKKSATPIGPDDIVEIIQKPDGTRVRRITRKKPKKTTEQTGGGPTATQAKNDLGKFFGAQKMEKQSNTASTSGSAASASSSVMVTPELGTSAASVAGDQLTVDKRASVTGTVYIRADGKRVKKVKKKPETAVRDSSFVILNDKTKWGENCRVEIITRADGTKVRRIYKKRNTINSEKLDTTTGTKSLPVTSNFDPGEMKAAAMVADNNKEVVAVPGDNGFQASFVPKEFTVLSNNTTEDNKHAVMTTADKPLEALKATTEEVETADLGPESKQGDNSPHSGWIMVQTGNEEGSQHVRETESVVSISTPMAESTGRGGPGNEKPSVVVKDNAKTEVANYGIIDTPEDTPPVVGNDGTIPEGYVLVPKATLQESERRQNRLEKILASAGIAIVEEIDYAKCVEQIRKIGIRMEEIGSSDVTHPDKDVQYELQKEYYILEQEIQKYESALVLTDEYKEQEMQQEVIWEDTNKTANEEALKKLRKHMPVNIRQMSEVMLTQTASPNNKYLPKAIAKKFLRTNVLQLLRRDPEDIIRVHPSTLKSLRVIGLTLTERRALHAHLLPCGEAWKKMTSNQQQQQQSQSSSASNFMKEKFEWYTMMRNNFKECLSKYEQHVKECGTPGCHVGCTLLGKQCPLRADQVISYEDDYGYPEDAQYEVRHVQKSQNVEDTGKKAISEAQALAKEKKSNERSDALKSHYKGKLLQLTSAIGNCESMDDAIERMENRMMTLLEEDVINNNTSESRTDNNDDEWPKIKKELSSFISLLKEFKFLSSRICRRAGINVSGAKKKNSKTTSVEEEEENQEDVRSSVECYLAEEFIDTIRVFDKFVRDRMTQKHGMINDQRVPAQLNVLSELLVDLHSRNVSTLETMGLSPKGDNQKKVKKQKDMEDEILKKQKKMESSSFTGGKSSPNTTNVSNSIEKNASGERLTSDRPPHPLLGSASRSISSQSKLGGSLLDAIKNRGNTKKTMIMLNKVTENTVGGGIGHDPAMKNVDRGGLLDAIKSRGSALCV